MMWWWHRRRRWHVVSAREREIVAAEPLVELPQLIRVCHDMSRRHRNPDSAAAYSVRVHAACERLDRYFETRGPLDSAAERVER